MPGVGSTRKHRTSRSAAGACESQLRIRSSWRHFRRNCGAEFRLPLVLRSLTGRLVTGSGRSLGQEAPAPITRTESPDLARWSRTDRPAHAVTHPPARRSSGSPIDRPPHDLPVQNATADHCTTDNWFPTDSLPPARDPPLSHALERRSRWQAPACHAGRGRSSDCDCPHHFSAMPRCHAGRYSRQ